MISPHILSIILKKVKKCIELNHCEKAIAELDTLESRDLDPFYFPHSDDIKNTLWKAQLLLILECPLESLMLIADVRNILDEIMIKNLWMADRLSNEKATEDSIGNLIYLPFDLRFMIFQDLLKSL
jgi:hypothetical protein